MKTPATGNRGGRGGLANWSAENSRDVLDRPRRRHTIQKSSKEPERTMPSDLNPDLTTVDRRQGRRVHRPQHVPVELIGETLPLGELDQVEPPRARDIVRRKPRRDIAGLAVDFTTEGRAPTEQIDNVADSFHARSISQFLKLGQPPSSEDQFQAFDAKIDDMAQIKKLTPKPQPTTETGDAVTASALKSAIGRRLMLARESLGMNPSTFARRVGISQPKLWNYEVGKNYPDPLVLLSACQQFGFTMEYFYRNNASGMSHERAMALRDIEVQLARTPIDT